MYVYATKVNWNLEILKRCCSQHLTELLLLLIREHPATHQYQTPQAILDLRNTHFGHSTSNVSTRFPLYPGFLDEGIPFPATTCTANMNA